MTELTIDEAHVYRRNGVIVPGTNEILNFYLPITIPEDRREDALKRGENRHLWYDAIAQGYELNNEPDPRIAGEVKGFRKFWTERKPVYQFSEKPFLDPIGVAGKPDLVCVYDGFLSVFDYKPKTKNKRTKLQTAAYLHNLVANGIKVVRRYELRLLDDDYRVERHDDDSDIPRWCVMVSAWNARSYYL